MGNELNCIITATGLNVYVILRSLEDGVVGEVYNTSSETFENWDSLNLIHYAMTMTDIGGNLYAADMPNVAKGNYLRTVYRQIGATPDASDLVIDTKSFYWNGTQAEICLVYPEEPEDFSGTIFASYDYRGTFIQGTTASLMLKITDNDGNAIDPTEITLKIQTGSGITILSATTPEKAQKGYYVYDWEIDDDQTEGDYTVIWTFTACEVRKIIYQDVIVAKDGDDTEMYTGWPQKLRLSLESYIQYAMTIPIYNEQAKQSRDNRTFDFSFQRWNQTPSIKVYRNGNRIIESSLWVNYFKGEIKFANPLSRYDVINADYNFRWFSDEELDRFLDNAILTLNSFPPHSGYTMNNIVTQGARFVSGVLYKAACDALRTLMFSLQFQEPQQVFGGPDNAQKAFSNIETLKKNYEEEWKLIFENKKYFPYKNLTKIISVSEMTLPGGRSLLPGTLLVVCLDDQGEKTISLQNLFDVCKNDKVSACVLSYDANKKDTVFAPINVIWASGVKKVYEIITQDGHSVASSDEHLFYVNNSYQPLMNIKEGDLLTIYEDGKLFTSPVSKIKTYKRPEIMYDLEVKSTANLFANGIKCHNSRWFRMLFSNSSGG